MSESDPKERADEPYLWDRSEPVDPTVVRLEQLLSPLRHEAPLAKPQRNRGRLLALGSALAIAAVVTWLLVGRPPAPSPKPPAPIASTCASQSPGSYPFRTEGGNARCDAENRATGWVPKGGVLETPAGSTATLDVPSLGTIAIEPGTKLRLLAANDNVQKLDLVRGTLRARIDAPPRLFIVKTAAADAVDLGCEYTLHVDEAGTGELAVSYGSVSLERVGHAPTLVVEHSTCRIGPRGPGIPLAASASPALRRAADELDGGEKDAFDRLLRACGAGDTITLWHVMRRIDPEERGRAWDRLAAFVPPPSSAPRDQVVRGERAAIAGYKQALLPVWFAR